MFIVTEYAALKYCSEMFTHDVNNIEYLINNRILNTFNIILLMLYALEDSLSVQLWLHCAYRLAQQFYLWSWHVQRSNL